MQGLLIVTNIIGVITLFLGIYTIFVLHKSSKLNNDKESQHEYYTANSKKFLLFLIISVLLFVGNIIGLALLAPLSSSEGTEIIFPAISLSISIYPIIVFFTFLLSAKKTHYTEKQMQSEKMEKKTQLDDEEYLRSHFKQVKLLSKKYYEKVSPFLDKMSGEIKLSYYETNKIVSKYRNQVPIILKKIFEYDGFKFSASSFYLPYEQTACELIDELSVELKNNIISNNEWEDNKTLPCLIYFILRNAILTKYWYVDTIPNGKKNYEAETAEDVAEEQRLRENEKLRKQQEERIREETERKWRIEEEKNRAAFEQKRHEEELSQHEQLIKSFQQVKENSPALIKKYAYTVENLIDKLTQIHTNLFINLFNDSCDPLASILVYPYRNINSPLLKSAIKHDGLIFDKSTNENLNTGIFNIIEPYIEKLKEEICNNNEWTDESALPNLIYKIIRNNVIKHYYNVYKSQVGYENLEEFCLNISNPIREIEFTTYLSGEEIKNKILIANKVDTVWFIYYYIYEHDIDLPFVDTYKKLCVEIQQTIEKQKEQKKYEESEKLKKELFDSHKVKNEPIKNTVRYVSPIEKVDSMTGEQFELFMTQYFAEHGFKATHTPLSGDFGIDLILENDFGKIGVQAKCYSKKVPQDAIREVVAGLKHYGLSSGMVVTNNYFQPAAIQLAKDNNVTLWDRNMLIKKLGE